MADQIQLKRKGTMQETAKEGVQYLKDSGHDILLDLQGLKDTESSTSAQEPPVKIQKMSTMLTTAEEGEEFLHRFDKKGDKKSDEGNDSECVKRTRTIQATIDEAEHYIHDIDAESRSSRRNKVDNQHTEDEVSSKDSQPALSRFNTIKETKEAAQDFLGTDSRGETRSQTKVMCESGIKDSPQSVEESKNGDDANAELRRTTTIVNTTKDADYYLGSSDYGSSRSETKQMRSSEQVDKEDGKTASLKRAGTMAETAASAKHFLKDENLGDSRSQSRQIKDADDDDVA